MCNTFENWNIKSYLSLRLSSSQAVEQFDESTKVDHQIQFLGISALLVTFEDSIFNEEGLYP